MRRLPPVIALYLLAPFLAEVMSTSTSILEFLAPWSLIPNATLYGGGTLLIREATRRLRLGLPGLVALGAAFGVFEEATLLRTWFAPEFLESHADYSRVWQTSILLAGHLTAFHVAVSIGASIALVEWLYPANQGLPWAGRRGMVIAALGLIILLAVSWIFPQGFYAVHWPQEWLSLALVAALCLLALRLPRSWPQPSRGASRRRYAWIIAALTISHFAIVWGVPVLGVPWPLGVALALAPVIAGYVMAPMILPTLETDRLSGLVLGLIWPLVGIDLVFVTSGRFDAIGAALLGALGLWWVGRQHQPARLLRSIPKGH